MKTQIFKQVLTLFCLLLIYHLASGQNIISGSWEGKFMGDFKTIIEFKTADSGKFTGSIKMFNDEIQIQNDPISGIDLTEKDLEFFIPAKETFFKGKLNNDYSAVSGVFIFPDKSEHPIELLKSNDKPPRANSSETHDENCITFNKKQLLEDVNFLVENLREYHPELYRYTSKNEFDLKIKNIENQIISELSLVEFYRIAAPLIESVKCSHTGIRLPNLAMERIKQKEKFFPLQLLFTGDKTFCTNNPNEHSEIKPGTEIISINNRLVEDIKSTLYEFLPSEGKNISAKKFQLNNNFNLLYYLIDEAENFEVNFKTSDKYGSEILSACHFDVVPKQKIHQEEMSYSLDFNQKEDIAILNINSFQIPDINLFIQDMNNIFSKIQSEEIQNLILDLRGNSGGHPIFAAQLFSYLTSEDFTWFERNEMVKDFEPLYNKMQPDKLYYQGSIFVLTNGACLSTTGHLISHLKSETNAVFIGEEPGSTYRCNDFSKKIVLPNTKIEVNIPRTTFETAILNPEMLVPFPMDHYVEIQLDDYLKQKDTVKNYAYRIISNYTFP